MDSTTPAVVDTDVVSFLFKAHSLAPAYQAILAGRPLAVSLITLAEIECGMEVKNWGGTRRDLMRRFLTRFTPLLPDTETAGLWASIKSACKKSGRPITFADAWIAAAAIQLNVPLVTHNANDYAVVPNLTVLTVTTPIT
jgi:predicted nucleic acid-binding protein